MDVANLVIRADTSQVKTATKDLNNLSNAGGKAESSSKSLARAFGAMRAALPVAGLGLLAAQMIKSADALAKFSAQLRNATSSQAEFGEAFDNVRRIASSAQAPIEAIGSTYARLSNALKDLNVTQAQVSDVAETVALGLKVNGASAEETASAMLQLSQSFGSGKMQGDEFRSAMESMPSLMREVAKTMGVTVGELKALSSEGAITSEVLLKTFNNPVLLAKLREQAGGMKTIGGSMTEAKNELLLFAGTMAQKTGIVSGFNSIIDAGTTTLKGFNSQLTTGQTMLQSFLPSYEAYMKAMDEQNKKELPAPQNKLGEIIPRGSRIDKPLTRHVGLITDISATKKAYDALNNSFKDFSEIHPLKDIQSANEEYARSIALVRANVLAMNITQEEGKRYEVQLNEELEKKIKSANPTGIKSSNPTENKRATELAEDYKALLSSASELNKAEQTNYEILQDKLNAMSGLDPLVKSYVQSNIDLAKATALHNEAENERGERIAENVRKQMEFNAEVEKVKDAVDPQREYNREIAKLAEMYDMGRLSADEFSKAAQQSQQYMLGFKDTAKDGFADLERAIDGFAKNSATSLADFIFGTKTSFGDMVNSMLKDIARLALQKSIFDPIAEGISKSFDSGSGIWGGLGNMFGINQSHANGIDYVPRDMLANIHQGERILTRDENKNYAQGGGNVSVNVTVNSDGSSNVQSDASFGKQLGNAIKSVVQAELLKQKRQGGMLSA